MDSRMLSAEMAYADHCGTERQGFMFPVMISVASDQWPVMISVVSDQWPVVSKIKLRVCAGERLTLLHQNFLNCALITDH